MRGALSGAGGGVGAYLSSSKAVLYNVTISDSVASNPALGVAISSLHEDQEAADVELSEQDVQIDAALLTIRQTCAAGGRDTALIGRGRMRVRNVTIDAPGCDTPLANSSKILDCKNVSVCGPRAACSKSKDSLLKTPLCKCPPPDPDAFTFDLVPSTSQLDPSRDSSITAAVAPFVYGCEPEQPGLRPNWWRLSDSTAAAYTHRCITIWSEGSGRRTPCKGGITADGTSDDLCYSGRGLTGPLCRVCSQPGHYFDEGGAECRACSWRPEHYAWLFVGVSSAGALAFTGLVWLLQRERTRWQRSPHARALSIVEQAVEQAAVLVMRIGLVGKAKVAIGYFQVMFVVPELFGLTRILPPEYFEFMRFLDVFDLDRLLWADKPECMGRYDDRLPIKTLVPSALLLALVLVGGIAGLALGWVGRAASKMAGARTGVLRVLPATLVLMLWIFPAICATLFATASCESFGYDADEGRDRYFLQRDHAIECDPRAVSHGFVGGFATPDRTAFERHYRAVSFSRVFVVFWTLGVPFLLVTLLLASQGTTSTASDLRHAIAFLYSEYRPVVPYWEIGELVRKLVLTGFLFLVPANDVARRAAFAVLVSVAHLVLLMGVRPYKQASTALVAYATAIALLLNIILALLVRWRHEEDAFDEADFYRLVAILVALNFAVPLFVVALYLYQLHVERRGGLATLKVQATGEPPALVLAARKRWHLFLSHNWANQDVVATIKRQLQLLLPGVSVFLDVDDLQAVDQLEAYIGASQAMLVMLGDPRYFGSPNCLREVAAAQAESLPLVLVHDRDPQKNGAPISTLTDACPQELHDFIFGENELIPWLRKREFQLLTMKRIAERLLLASPAYSQRLALPLTLSGEDQALRFSLPVVLRVLAVNQGAHQAAREIAQSGVQPFRFVVEGDAQSDKDAANARFSSPSTAPVPAAAMATHCLLYLNSTTFIDDGGALAEAVREAVRAGLPVVLVHENDPSAGGCEFAAFFRSTPRDLIDSGLYGCMQAVAWHPPPYRDVSIRLLVQAISTSGDRPQPMLRASMSALTSQPPGWSSVFRRAGRRAQLARRVRVQSQRFGGSTDGTELIQQRSDKV